jgi:hypothetical protein
MCRNIKQLRNFDQPPTGEEIKSAALQYVRKVSGYRVPSRANHEAFDQAIDEIAASTQKLLESLVSKEQVISGGNTAKAAPTGGPEV